MGEGLRLAPTLGGQVMKRRAVWVQWADMTYYNQRLLRPVKRFILWRWGERLDYGDDS